MDKAEAKKEKSGIIDWLMEDDSPEIGIATKEPIGDYFRGVKTEFSKIEWPTKEQLRVEFIAVIVIAAIISLVVFAIDIGLDKVIATIKGK
jgi:preprotein translocase subunit SecE